MWQKMTAFVVLEVEVIQLNASLLLYSFSHESLCLMRLRRASSGPSGSTVLTTRLCSVVHYM